MSMSTHIEGIIPPDDKFKKMMEIFNLCSQQGIDPPEEVWKFFNNEDPDPHGTVIRLEDVAEEWGNESASGLQILLEDIPKHVKIIRFYNSW